MTSNQFVDAVVSASVPQAQYDGLKRVYDELRRNESDFAADTQVTIGRLRRERNRLARHNHDLDREAGKLHIKIREVAEERDDIHQDYRNLRSKCRDLEEKLAAMRYRVGGRNRARGYHYNGGRGNRGGYQQSGYFTHHGRSVIRGGGGIGGNGGGYCPAMSGFCGHYMMPPMTTEGVGNAAGARTVDRN